MVKRDSWTRWGWLTRWECRLRKGENTESGCTLAQPHPYESLLEVEKRVNLQIKSQSFWGELSLDSGHRRKAQHFLTSSSPSNPPLNVCFRYVCNDWEGKAQRFRFSFSRHRMTIWYGWPCLSLPSFLGRLSTFHPSSVLSSRLLKKKEENDSDECRDPNLRNSKKEVASTSSFLFLSSHSLSSKEAMPFPR